MSETPTNLNETDIPENATIQSVSDVPVSEKPVPEKPKKKWKTTVFWIVVFVICAASLLFIILKDFVFNPNKPPPGEISSTLGQVIRQNWYYLFIAIGCCAAYFVFQSLVYAVMMHKFTGKPRFGLCLATTMLGTFYDGATPFATGGQPFQIAYLQKHKVPEGTSITLPMVEYTLDRFVFVLFSIAAIIICAVNVFGPNAIILGVSYDIRIALYTTAAVGIALNFAFPFLMILALFSKKACGALTRFAVKTAKFFRLTKNPDKLYERIMSKLEANIECMKQFSKRKRLYLCILITIVERLFMASVGYFVIKAFGYSSPHGWGWAEIVVLSFIIMNSVSFIPTPGSSGAADFTFYGVFYTALSATGAAGVASLATISWRVISFYLPLLIGLFYVLAISSSSRKKKPYILK